MKVCKDLEQGVEDVAHLILGAQLVDFDCMYLLSLARRFGDEIVEEHSHRHLQQRPIDNEHLFMV